MALQAWKVSGAYEKWAPGHKRDREFNGNLQANLNMQMKKMVLNIIFTQGKMTDILSVQPFLIKLPPNIGRDSFMYSIPRSMSSGSWSSVFNFTTFLVCSDKLVTTAYVWWKKKTTNIYSILKYQHVQWNSHTMEQWNSRNYGTMAKRNYYTWAFNYTIPYQSHYLAFSVVGYKMRCTS